MHVYVYIYAPMYIIYCFCCCFCCWLYKSCSHHTWPTRPHFLCSRVDIFTKVLLISTLTVWIAARLSATRYAKRMYEYKHECEYSLAKIFSAILFTYMISQGQTVQLAGQICTFYLVIKHARLHNKHSL